MAAHPNRSGSGGPSSNPRPEEIRAFRLAAGLTLQQAGELVHSGKRSWEDWESGRRRMHPAFWELANLKNPACAA